MEVKEFVKKTTVEIIKGIQEAKTESGHEIHIASQGKSIEFDMAVYVESSTEKGGKLSVWNIGAQLDSKISSSTVHRIKFNVYADDLTINERKKAREKLKHLNEFYSR